MDYREVEVDIVRRRFGNIGGIYNIMWDYIFVILIHFLIFRCFEMNKRINFCRAHKMQLRKLNGSFEMKSLRTPRIVKHKHEKSRYTTTRHSSRLKGK